VHQLRGHPIPEIGVERKVTFKKALACIRDIHGWLEEDEAETLYRFVLELGTRGAILEIGSWHGKSTIVLASAAKRIGSRVFAVDPHEGITYWQDDVPPMRALGPSLEAFRENLRHADLTDVVKLLVMTSRRAFEQLKDREHFSLAFIDGDHSYRSVREDFEMWSQCLVEGGVIAFHDSNGRMQGPRRVVAEVKEREDFEFLSLVGQLTSFRKRDVAAH